MTSRLCMRGVKKSFGATHALKDVSIEVAAGEVHALIGENGAGKSTLMKILSGAYKLDQGEIELDGKPFAPTDPLHARQCGVVMIYQELNLAPHLSVEENIVLGLEPSHFGWINRSRRKALANQALAELDHQDIPMEAPVHSLSVAEQQVVEIARALLCDTKILVMDEPTSSLSHVDVDKLFGVIKRLRQRGVSIVYISHFLEECQSVADRYTVLRDGETVATGEMAGADMQTLIRLMVGREITEIYPRREHKIGEPVLEIRQLRGEIKPSSVSMVLRAGEILGIAGLVGAGRTETLRACFGLDAVKDGMILVMKRESTYATPARRLAEGMGFSSENRKEEGLMLNQSLANNLTLTRLKPFTTLGFINNFRQRLTTQDWMETLDIRAQSPEQIVAQLSGGNQQKLALGRLLYHQARILLLDEPTRGIDVASKVQIYKLLTNLVLDGKAIIFVSSYLPELLGICDTIGVMCRGMLVAMRPAVEWSEEAILSAAIGQSGD